LLGSVEVAIASQEKHATTRNEKRRGSTLYGFRSQR
jgi:hypothetical protein